MPRATTAEKVRPTRTAIVSSIPANDSSTAIGSLGLSLYRSLRFPLTVNARKGECCFRGLSALECFESLSVRIDVCDQLRGIDSQVPGGVPPHLVRSALKERDRTDQVAILEMVVRRADLDESLEEESPFAVLLFPDLLEDFVGLEEVLVIEEANRFLDRVEPGRGLRLRHRKTQGRRSNQPFRPGESIVWITSEVYLPRSVTIAVMSFPGMTSKSCRIRSAVWRDDGPSLAVVCAAPGQEAASYRESNFMDSHTT